MSIVAAFLVGVLGIGLGLSSAQYFLDDWIAMRTVREGPWISWPRATAPDADPYTRAFFARHGTLPPPPSESIAFEAVTDSAGAPLQGNCTYRVEGGFPASRAWTLTVSEVSGALMPNPARRYAFNDREALRVKGEPLVIRVGPEAAPGNWVPTRPDRQIKLVARLYDTPLATEALLLDTTMPAIVREDCR
jgi:hypothetical protein